MTPPILRLPLAAAALVAALGATACASAPRAEPAPIAPEVLERVRSADSVGVVVILVTPSSYYGGNSQRVRSDIAGMQQSVLGALEPGQYRLRERFQSVPAMTLVVYGEPAIRTLALHRHVERIELDDGSAGRRR